MKTGAIATKRQNAIQEGESMEPTSQDVAIRREVLATLKANPAVSYDIVLKNWAYHRGEDAAKAEAARVEVIFEQERADLAVRLATLSHPWWRFW